MSKILVLSIYRFEIITKLLKLTESIEVKEKKHFDLSSIYGAWEDTRSSDEIINNIKNSRIEKERLKTG